MGSGKGGTSRLVGFMTIGCVAGSDKILLYTL